MWDTSTFSLDATHVYLHSNKETHIELPKITNIGEFPIAQYLHYLYLVENYTTEQETTSCTSCTADHDITEEGTGTKYGRWTEEGDEGGFTLIMNAGGVPTYTGRHELTSSYHLVHVLFEIGNGEIAHEAWPF